MSSRLYSQSVSFSAILLTFIFDLLAGVSSGATLVDFENLSYGGPGSHTGPSGSYWNGSDSSGGFNSSGVPFTNNYNTSWGTWNGWAYSNVNDVTTSGYTNQYAAYTGTGVGGDGNYAVGYGYFDPYYSGDIRPVLAIPEGMQVQSAMFTNTTYPALAMRNGYYTAKKFGGSSGSDPDWFKLTIYGKDSTGTLLPSSAALYLADYRNLSGEPDYILNTWQTVDLSVLSAARSLIFDLTSSDTDPTYGMNTPAFFAMDNLTLTSVPEPSTLAMLCAVGLAAAFALRRWIAAGCLNV